MNKILFSLLISLNLIVLNTRIYGSVSSAEPDKQDTIAVLVVYYSLTGNTEKMAAAVMAGAVRVPSVTAIMKTPDSITADDLRRADVILMGSPTYYGNMAGPVVL